MIGLRTIRLIDNFPRLTVDGSANIFACFDFASWVTRLIEKPMADDHFDAGCDLVVLASTRWGGAGL
jgi:hypothetical protein